MRETVGKYTTVMFSVALWSVVVSNLSADWIFLACFVDLNC